MSRRGVLALAACCVALVLQVSALSHLAWHGVYPDLVLVVVVTAGLVCGAQFGMVLGFAAGLLLDLAPPADHAVGRWALALLVVGLVAGMVRPDALGSRPAVLPAVGTVAVCSFLGTSLFALTGLVLGERSFDVPELLTAVVAGVAYDVVVSPLVVPWLSRLLVHVGPDGPHRAERRTLGLLGRGPA